jgi:cephalosporin hydroxylase
MSPDFAGKLLGRRREPGTDYHLWYYNTSVWKTTSWLGVPCAKSVSDMWNYQEILVETLPTTVCPMW